jgi:hypothetical protein
MGILQRAKDLPGFLEIAVSGQNPAMGVLNHIGLQGLINGLNGRTAFGQMAFDPHRFKTRIQKSDKKHEYPAKKQDLKDMIDRAFVPIGLIQRNPLEKNVPT